MHVCIATKVCSKFELEGNRFLLGSIAPDAHLPSRELKIISHFAIKSPEEGDGPYIDSNAFLHKYKDYLNDSFFLGYYCHLLSDELWFSEVYNKYLSPYENEEQKLRMYYKDFDRLNSKLIKHYKLNDNALFFDDFSMQEINIDVFRHIFDELKKDFRFYKRILAKPLQILEFENIKNYIEKAAELSVHSIESICVKRIES